MGLSDEEILRIAKEINPYFSGNWAATVNKFARRILAEAGKNAEPVAWRYKHHHGYRDWNFSDTAIKLSETSIVEPLFTSPQRDKDTIVISGGGGGHIGYEVGGGGDGSKGAFWVQRTHTADAPCAKCAELGEKIENANQAASETQKSWKHRCFAIMRELGSNYGDPDWEMPDEIKRAEAAEAKVEELERKHKITHLNNALFVEQWERLCAILGIEKCGVVEAIDAAEARLTTARNDALEEAAKICDANEAYSLKAGEDEQSIGAYNCARDLRALRSKP